MNPTLKILKGKCFCGIHGISNPDEDEKKKRTDPVHQSGIGMIKSLPVPNRLIFAHESL